MTKVAVYGAGIGGLSAAHELVERGFDVVVYEAGGEVGGKAVSQFLASTGSGGRLDLPGEHGFRFFPAFYAHLDHTMQRIPTPDGGTVFEYLKGSKNFAVARLGNQIAKAPRRIRRGVAAVADLVDVFRIALDREGLELAVGDFVSLSHALLRVWLASEERRQVEHDEVSWFDFAGAGSHSKNYQRLTSSLPRTMVAMDGRAGSAYTIGKVASQLFIFDAFRNQVDRVLNGPTTLRWLDPWKAYLEAPHHPKGRSVRFVFGAPLAKLVVDRSGRRIRHGVLADGTQVEADFHVAAVPVEVMQGLVDDDIAAVSPELEALRGRMAAATDWMVGVQYFLDREIDLCDGHVIYTDSHWALSSVSQAQFWRYGDHRPFHQVYGDGSVHDVLSVDVSDWSEVAPRLGKAARESTREEIVTEVFNQIVDAVTELGNHRLTAANVRATNLDWHIRFDPVTGQVVNTTPLLVHRPGHFKHRPPAASGEIVNLMLASDYVVTHTNLATMEGANEAARRAVRGIMEVSGEGGDMPEIHEMHEPAFLAPFKKFDRWLLGRKRAQAIDLDDAAQLDELRAARQAHAIEPSDIDAMKGALDGEARYITRDDGVFQVPALVRLQHALDEAAADPA